MTNSTEVIKKIHNAIRAETCMHEVNFKWVVLKIVLWDIPK